MTSMPPLRLPCLTRKLTMNRGILLPLPFLVLTVHGCAGSPEPGAGPSPDDPTQPHADVSGSWTYSETVRMDLGRGVTVRCSESDRHVDIAQSGSSLSITTVQEGKIDCDDPSFEPSGQSGGKPIRGTVEGTSVRFTVEVDGFIPVSYSGRVAGNSVSGTSRGTGILAGIGPISVTGNWSASRSDGRGS